MWASRSSLVLLLEQKEVPASQLPVQIDLVVVVLRDIWVRLLSALCLVVNFRNFWGPALNFFLPVKTSPHWPRSGKACTENR